MRRHSLTKPLPLLLAALLAAVPAQAQESADDGPAGQEEPSPVRRTEIIPYIEASQVVSWQFSPGDDVVTYTQLAAGIDAAIAGRNSGGTASIRYERNFAWDKHSSDIDTISGIARGYASIIPNVLTVEAGALASRTRMDGNGVSVISPLGNDDQTSQTYSIYAGPSLQTRVDDVDVSASYRLGYTRVEQPDVFTRSGTLASVFDDSVTHTANLRAGTRPGEPLPVGIGVGAGFFQEDVNALDQRVRDAWARGDVTVPITSELAIVGGVGVEDVEVSSRDALRDTNGDPVIGSDGRYVTDSASPRRIAYDADGLIWDVGVIWQPSRRTRLEAHFGHRYDSETYYGSFSWQPDRRSNLSINVYDGISGFGGRMNNSLANLPTDFQVIRDPVTGQISGCTSTVGGANCLDALLGSVRSSAFRSRGVTLSYSRQIGRLTAGIGAGYDNRRFIGARDTVLAAANGIEDENWYIGTNLSGPLGPRGTFTLDSYANWFDSGVAGDGDMFGLGTSASYTQEVYRNLFARAAVAVTMLDSDFAAQDIRAVTALIGLRYSF